MGIESYPLNEEIRDIFDYVRQRLKKGPCDSKTLAQELNVDIEFLSNLLWQSNASANVDFDPSKSTSGNIMWEYWEDDRVEPNGR